MKKLKFMPAVLLLIASFAILAIGIYAVAPTKNTLKGTITVNSANPEVLISAFFHNEEGGTLTEDDYIMYRQPARHGVEIDLGDSMKFDTSECNTQEDLQDLDIKVTIRVENPGSAALGVYFSKTAMTAEATADDIAKEKMLTDSTGEDDFVKATMEGYKGLPAKSGDDYGMVETTVTFSLLQYVTGDTNPTVNLGADENKVYLNIENCNDELIEAIVVETSGSSVSKDMVDEALAGATGMVKVEIPEGVTEISANAFENNTSITNVVLSSSVTSIGFHAFYGCSNLTSIEIPNGVTDISGDAFYDCRSLTSVTYEHNVEGYYDFKDGTLTIKKAFTTDTNPAWRSNVFCLGSLILNVEWGAGIAESTTIIPSHAFRNCHNLTSIEIPDGVTSIGKYAFMNCSDLTSIEIPNGVTSITDDTFLDCSSLNSIVIPNSLTSIGFNAFNGCKSINSVTYEKSGSCYNYKDGTLTITTAFAYTNEAPSFGGSWYDDGLAPLILHVQWIDNVGKTCMLYDAVLDAYNLKTIELPENLLEMSETTFKDCESLKYNIWEEDTNIKYLGNSQNPYLWLMEITDKTVESITIHPDCKYIYASLSGLNEDVYNIDPEDTNLKYLGSTNNPYFILAGVNSVTASSVAINANCKIIYSLGGSYNNQWSNLTSIIIPDGVVSIYQNAISYCNDLKAIWIPSSVTSIGMGAFSCVSGEWIMHLYFEGGHPSVFINSDKNSCISIDMSSSEIDASFIHANASYDDFLAMANLSSN